MTDIVFESPRIASTDPIIYTDRVPKNMYEYFLNGYKEADIRKLIENIKMSFETWDKTYNLYKSSNQLMELCDGEIAVLYEDLLSNQFIFSTVKNKVYYYQSEVAPYIDLSKGMTIEQFLEMARNDFNALMRTNYGKKYITEQAVILEGLKEFFGYGKALRIFIDGRNVKNSSRYAIDKHSFAFIDALDDYSAKLITKSEFSKIINHPNTVVEIYDNHALGSRDVLRRMPVNSEALIESKTCTLVDLAKDFDQDLEDIYNDYVKAKAFKLMCAAAKPLLDAYLKKNPVLKAAYITNDDKDLLTLDQLYNLSLLSVSEYANYSYIASFDLAKFKRAYLASINTKFQKFNNSDTVDRFLAHIDYLLGMFESCDKTRTWHFYGSMKPNTETEVRNTCKGICYIRATTYPAMKDTVFKAPPPEPEAKTMLKNVNSILYEYMTGYPLDVLQEDQLKLELDFEYGNLERGVEQPKEFSDNEINEMIQARVDNSMMDEFLTEESMDATMYYVALERDTSRSIGHNVRAGLEKVGKAVDKAKRAANTVVGPIMDKTKDIIDSIKKSSDEDKREIAITDSSFAKLRNFFKSTALPTAITYFALGPALAIVAFLTAQAKKNSDDKRARDKVIRELEMELKLTREKIEDARRKDDDKAKYELMRLESRIEDNIAEIKYGHD